MKYHFAPVQGHTDAAYRTIHASVYGALSDYYTPFIRLEKDDIRPRDSKDMSSDNNPGIDLTPQIIFRDSDELHSLLEIMKLRDVKKIDLNMGCPFPLQTARGRGAATIAGSPLHDEVVRIIGDNPDISFSVKIRLGMKDPEEWKPLVDALNSVKLRHLTVHPRVASQQYKGEVDLAQFEKILAVSRNPVVYNGDLKTPDDIRRIENAYPEIEGIMIGRGLLGRPSLIAEYTSGEEWPHDIRLKKMLAFHNKLISHYSEVLCGDTQLISKIAPFWEYAEYEIGRKAWKALKKASNIAKYHSAVAMVE